VSRLARWLVAGLVLLLGRGRPRRPEARIVERTDPSPRAETAILVALAGTTLCAVGFLVVYALDRLPRQTQLLGLALGGAFAFLAVACVVAGKHVLPDREIEHAYPPLHHPQEESDVAEILEESGEAFTRRRLLTLAAGGAGTAVGLALIAPAVSLGPVLHTDALLRTPWQRGRRLVDEDGNPYAAGDIDVDSFFTAYAEHWPRENFASPLVVIRLAPERLDLPDGRADWAPGGILAYSKICTHAGCAVSEYRAPLFEPTSDRPALVCPCHYSTFDPATGGTVLVGPAGRPLPQLPLELDGDGNLRAAGPLSDGPGPSWSGVRR
jgi:ubiquinol-cytochrome c reductase iron-sulfur subunit